MATICTIKKIPEMFEGFALHLIKLLPSGYKHVDIVADAYQENSISLWKEKIEEMQVKYLLNQQSREVHGTLLVFYQRMITKQK